MLPAPVVKLLSICPNGDIALTGHPGVASSFAQALRLRNAWTCIPPASARLPVPYHVVPEAIRTFIACCIGRYQRSRSGQWASFPRWPLDLSADFLQDLATGMRPPSKAIVVLTHDLDSAEGLRNALDLFFPLEEAAGVRSTNFIVPCKWQLDYGILDELTRRGHELGIHGYNHANITPYAPAVRRKQRMEAAQPLRECYAITGYRAPSLVRTPQLYETLRDFYVYDSSMPTSGGLFPAPNNGCASARPFTLQGLTVLPLSMPRDGSLRFFGHSCAEILAIWKSCAKRIMRSGGIVVLLTHCEKRFSGNTGMLNAYRNFLEWATAQENCSFALARDVVGEYARSRFKEDG